MTKDWPTELNHLVRTLIVYGHDGYERNCAICEAVYRARKVLGWVKPLAPSGEPHDTD